MSKPLLCHTDLHEKDYVLSKELADAFYQRGYFVLDNLFTPDETEEMRNSFDYLSKLASQISYTDVYQGSHFVLNKNSIERVAWCCAAAPDLLKFGEDKRLVEPAADLLGSDLLQHLICQAHFKNPGDMVRFKWHQDSENRRYGTDLWSDVNGRGSYVQTILALDEMGPDNGPLLILPGSSELGHLSLNGENAPRIPLDTQLQMQMTPGSVLFLHPFTVHCSPPNRSNRPRRVFINGFAYPGANRRKYLGHGVGRMVRAQREAIIMKFG